jgi:hypothetical protein
VDVETTGTNPDRDKIIEFGICLFEYAVRPGGSTKFSAPGSGSKIPEVQSRPEITKITGITDEMIAGQRIDDRVVNDLLGRSGHPPCAGATAPRLRAAGTTGSLGTGEIADMAVMGEGRRHREEGYPQGPRLRLEPRRVRATKVLVSGRGGRR